MDTRGKRRHLVEIQQRGTGKDAWGTALPDDWVKVSAPWADILYPNGSEAVSADAVKAVTKVSIRIGYRTGITPAMRVKHGTLIYRILAVLPDARGRQHVDLACELAT